MADRRSGSGVSLKIDEPATVPLLDYVFAYGATLPLAAGLGAVFALPDPQAAMVRDLALYWGAAILLFFSGVRRGTSFRTMGGPTFNQIAMMFVLFGSGLASVLALSYHLPLLAGLLELVCYVGLGVLDPIAARRGELPFYFQRLRPVQMGLAALAVFGLTLDSAGYL